MEFHVDDTAGPPDERLVKTRLAITKADQVSDLFRAVEAHANSSAFEGKSLLSFVGLPLLVPRGKFDVDLYSNRLELHGKSLECEIPYTSITRLFLLPKPDGIHIAFIISLDPPVRRGNTMHPHILFHFQSEEQTSVSIKMDPKQLAAEANDNITAHDATWRIFSRAVRTITGRPVCAPKTFESKDKHRAVRTSFGTNQGYLFFLESSLFYINKPPTYIPFGDIDVVKFQRMNIQRKFDLAVTTNAGDIFLFHKIDRSEIDSIYNFLSAMDVTMESAWRGKGDRGGDEDDEVDDKNEDELYQNVEAQTAREGHDGPTRKKRRTSKG